MQALLNVLRDYAAELMPESDGSMWRELERTAVRRLGMPAHVFLRRLPSLLRGGMRQSWAGLQAPERFTHTGGPAVMLIPGLFCTPSVFNRLGRELATLGLDVYLPRPFGFYHGVLANTDRLVHSLDMLLEDLERLKAGGLSRITLVGHSMGGLLALAALDAAARGGHDLPDLAAPVLLATPVNGAPIARPFAALVPACRDVLPEAVILQRLRAILPEVGRVVLSAEDSLLPEGLQLAPPADVVRMSGFQHMDFYVGNVEQVQRSARVIAEAVHAYPAGGAKPARAAAIADKMHARAKKAPRQRTQAAASRRKVK